MSTPSASWLTNPSTNPSHPHHYRLSLRSYALNQLHEISQAFHLRKIQSGRVWQLIDELFEKCEDAYREHLQQLNWVDLHEMCFIEENRVAILEQHVVTMLELQDDATEHVLPFEEYLRERLGYVPMDGSNSPDMQDTHENASEAMAAPTRRTLLLPHDSDEPLYVNPKQYNRILKRREQRLRMHKRLVLGEKKAAMKKIEGKASQLKIVGKLANVAMIPQMVMGAATPATGVVGPGGASSAAPSIVLPNGAPSGVPLISAASTTTTTTNRKRKQPDSQRIIQPTHKRVTPTGQQPQIPTVSPLLPQQQGLFLLGMVQKGSDGGLQILPSPGTVGAPTAFALPPHISPVTMGNGGSPGFVIPPQMFAQMAQQQQQQSTGPTLLHATNPMQPTPTQNLMPPNTLQHPVPNTFIAPQQQRQSASPSSTSGWRPPNGTFLNF